MNLISLCHTPTINRGNWRYLIKILTTMKLIMMLSVLFIQQANAMVNAQTITFSCKKVSLKEIFKEINQQTGYEFVYNTGMLEESVPVSVKLEKSTVPEALNKCFEGQPLGYVIEGKTIVVTQKATFQDVILKGKVTSTKGEPLPGITIFIKGTTRGTYSGDEGLYQLEIKTGDKIIVFSSIGMKKQEIEISGKVSLDIVMEEETAQLQDVVVTGIITRNANSFTGSSTTIGKEELFKISNKNLIQSLKILEPSMMVLDNLDMGSDPNTLPDIRLRGTSSFPQEQDLDLRASFVNNPNLPLFILDGFEINLTKVIDLDMNRIESVTILKDASAKALYGSKAANGVVVIETKKLTSGQLKISYNSSLDIEAPDLSSYNLMNSAEKLEAERIYGLYTQNTNSTPNYLTQLNLDQQYNRRLAVVLSGVNTDWMSKPLRNGIGQKHGLSIELGEKDLKAIADFSYNNIAGVMKGSSRKTYSTSIALSYRYKRFLFRNILSVSGVNSNDSPYGSFGEYSKMNPYWTPYDEFGNLKKNAESGIITYYGSSSIGNILIANPLYNSTLNTKITNNYVDITDNFYSEFYLIDGLKCTLRAGLTSTKNQADEFYPANHLKFDSYTGADYFRKGSYKRNEGDQIRYSGDFNVNYSKTFGEKHYVFANIGSNMSESNYENVIYQAEGFPNDRMTNILFANQYSKYNNRPTGSEGTTRDIGFLTVVNYSFDNRFFADASFRKSASSQFGSKSRWGSFWSAGIGWNIHNEKFIKDLDIFERLKLRGSIGSTGSQNFSSYQSISTYKYFLDKIYQNYLGAYLMGLANNNLKWQQKMDYNVGIDASLFKKLTIRLDYYRSITENTLIDYTLPPSSGFPSVKENLGKIRNIGFETMITYNVYSDPKNRSYFSLTASAIHNENKILSISDALRSYNEEQDIVANDRFNNKPIIKYYDGMSMDAIWAVRSLGIDPANGQEIYLTKDGEKTYTYSASNQVVVGDKMPKLSGTFGVNGEVKGLNISLMFRYFFGGQMYNQTLVDRVENVNMSYNVDKRVLYGTWQKPGDVKPFKALGSVEIQNADGSWTRQFIRTQPSDRFVQNRDEFSLASVNITYDFYKLKFIKNLGMERLRFGLYMNDAFLLSSIYVERGLSYPFSRKISFSLQATF